MTSRGLARQLTFAVAGLAALAAVGLVDAAIADDVDFTALYLAVIALVAWTSRLAIANLIAVTALVVSLCADVVANSPDLRVVLVWNGAGELAAFVGVAMLVHYARAERDELRRAATHDSLTGLPNRVLFLDRLEHALALSRRRGPGPSVLALDLDGFKQVNDTYGHPAGDIVLRATAERLSSCVRESDTCARFGGDEFAILLPYGGREGSARVVAAIERAFQRPFTIDGKNISLHPSIGHAIAPTDGDASAVLLRVADGCTKTNRPALGGLLAHQSLSTCTSTAERQPKGNRGTHRFL